MPESSSELLSGLLPSLLGGAKERIKYWMKKSKLILYYQPVELLAGHAREVELVAAESAVLRVAVVVQLSLRVAAQDVPRRV